MKILVVADEESAYLWDHYRPGRLAGIDLILSAGDLKPEYLSFLVTMANRPLLYVHVLPRDVTALMISSSS